MLLPHLIMGLYLGQNTLEPAPRRLLEMLQSVEVNQSDDDKEGVQQGFQITLAAARRQGRSADYELLKQPQLTPGHRVVITMTIGAQPRILIDGIITHQQLPFSLEGEATLVVTGHDISILMDLEEKNRGFKEMKHKEVVEQILSEYARLGITTQVTKPTVKWPTKPAKQMPMQAGVTDRAYLRSLAAAYGYTFYVKPGTKPGKCVAYWGPTKRQEPEQPALTVNMGAGTNVEKINFAFDAASGTQVGAAVADADTDKGKATTSGKGKGKPLAKDDPFGGNRTLLRTLWLGYAGPDANEAVARAQAITDQALEQTVTGTGTVDTLRYGDLLTAPGIVGLRGVGGSFDGKYMVKSVKHRISVTEYKQDFTIQREGIGTTVQQVRKS